MKTLVRLLSKHEKRGTNIYYFLKQQQHLNLNKTFVPLEISFKIVLVYCALLFNHKVNIL